MPFPMMNGRYHGKYCDLIINKTVTFDIYAQIIFHRLHNKFSFMRTVSVVVNHLDEKMFSFYAK